LAWTLERQTLVSFATGVFVGNLQLRSAGFSIVTSDETNVDKIEVNQIWPSGRNTGKVPSAIAYPVDNANENLTKIQWGFGVDCLTAYMWTKLQLGEDSRRENLISSGLLELYNDRSLTQPRRKGPKEVVTDYLTELYKWLETRLKARDEGLFNISPLEIWVTVPAMWTDAAKNVTLEAVRAAGFGKRPSDTVNMISEPEAAALAVITQQTGLGAITNLEVCRYLFQGFLALLIVKGKLAKHPHLRRWRRHCCK
jgi:hypothetical protein